MTIIQHCIRNNNHQSKINLYGLYSIYSLKKIVNIIVANNFCKTRI